MSDVYTNAVPVNAVPETRSESLANLFKGFMEADRELHDSRESLATLRVQANDAEMRLSKAETRWTEMLTKFAQFMAAEAPPQMQSELSRFQEQTQILGNSQGIGAATTKSRW